MPSFASWSRVRRSAETEPEPPLLDEALLAALRTLELPVRRVHGALSGAHAGTQAGAGEDFFQHRAYVRGEDVRAVDWRASARTGHLLVKELHRPLRQPLVLLLDASASMELPRGQSKARCARRLGAALAFLALRRQDPVTLLALGGGSFQACARALPAGRTAAVAERLFSPTVRPGSADLPKALAGLNRTALSGAHVVLLSDLYGEEARLGAALSSLPRAGAALTVVQVLSEADRTVPGAGALRDVETGEERLPGLEQARALGAAVAAWSTRLRSVVAQAGAEWVDADAGKHPAETLARWLHRRR